MNNKYSDFIKRISNVYVYKSANKQNINNFNSLSSDDKNDVLYEQSVCDALNDIYNNFPKTDSSIQKVFNHFYCNVLLGQAQDDFAIDIDDPNHVGKDQRELILSNIGVSILDISDNVKDDYGVLIDR